MTQIGFAELTLALLLPATLAASWSDFRRHKVPNWLNAVIAGTGLACHTAFLGWSGLQAGLLGMLVGFGMLIVLWLMRGMGAGDVKFMAAIGTWLGPHMTFNAVIVGCLLGGAMAVGMILYRRNFATAMTNLNVLAVKVSNVRTAFSEFGSAKSMSASTSVLPYAIPLSLGTLVVLVSDYSGWWEGL